MIENAEQRILAAKERAAGRSGDFSIVVENGAEVEQKLKRNDGRVDVTIPSAMPPARDTRHTIGDEHRMPDTSTEPAPDNSVKVGSLVVFHSDDGGFFETSRRIIKVVTGDGKTLKERDALWTLFSELRSLATAKKAK
jgi:hypothetical protein